MTESTVFTGTGDAAHDHRGLRQAGASTLRTLHVGVYTDNTADPASEVALRNAFTIAAHLCSQAILSGRSAFNARPSVAASPSARPSGSSSRASVRRSGPRTAMTCWPPTTSSSGWADSD